MKTPCVGAGEHVCAFAPHDLVFPRCAAIVHHAGMGSAAQALRSGRPQLAVPFFGDQPDIAARLVRLGVAERISSSGYTGAVAASALSRLLAKPRDACATMALAVEAEEGAERLADKVVALTD